MTDLQLQSLGMRGSARCVYRKSLAAPEAVGECECPAKPHAYVTFNPFCCLSTFFPLQKLLLIFLRIVPTFNIYSLIICCACKPSLDTTHPSVIPRLHNMSSIPPPKDTDNVDTLDSTPLEIFPLEEETHLLSEAHSEKTSANKTFASGDYSSAVQGYEKALASCPTYLEYDIAVLRSNIAACHIKLLEWKDAVESATQALDALDRIDPPRIATKEDEEGKGHIEEVDDAIEVRIAALTRTGKAINDVHKMRTKALLRRAKARREVGGWSSLQGSLEDYQALSKPPNVLTGLDREAVNKALKELPLALDEAKDREMKEMLGKLKQLGNGLLKPFGLSTDSFQFTKDEKSGGYSMGFNQGG
ncbi:hypothetical protein K504DRAFT_58220 [Pleomassaria siparia CBS 279.74]|uniref:Tetratricopeptide repeat protein 1 n=1 Tax=Pleomassaria siparia CBS 279.74 TaxID=1314801 RepID=A0A6G1K288_9PLEO|nr:hypothetical protein K504DRAFT_58220 [Pleomassaria siparia CBS 279.74]